MNILSFNQDLYDKITPREKEIIEALKQGSTTKDIAKKLGIAPKTVECHRTNLLNKTGSDNVAQMMVKLYQGGILG